MPEQSTAALLEKALSMLDDSATREIAKEHLEEALISYKQVQKEIAKLSKEAKELYEHCDFVVNDSNNLRLENQRLAKENAELKSDNQKLINQIPA